MASNSAWVVFIANFPATQRLTVTEPVCPFGPVTVVLEPLSLRVVSRVVVFPCGPVVLALVWPGLRSTWRVAKVLPWALVVLDDTSPWARLTSRVAALPLAPATVVWRSRARAGWVTMAVRHKAANAAENKELKAVFMVLSLKCGL
jgi:hypothetical protein